VVPLLTRVYPNGKADVNHFQAAGGMGFLIRELLEGGLLHATSTPSWGSGLDAYVQEPVLATDGRWSGATASRQSADESILRPCRAAVLSRPAACGC
jgi:phosphogluconate dehydratase